MKIYAVSMDRYLVAIGFRRIVAGAKKAGYDVHSVFFLDDARRASFAGSWWRQKTGDGFNVNYVRNDEALSTLSRTLAEADVLAFSLMSVQRNIAAAICRQVKSLNPGVRIMVGGYHPTLFPDDAITFADAICLGEGERAFVDFLGRVSAGKSLRGLPNCWVREDGEIIRNGRIPLMTSEEMEQMPFMDYDTENQYIFSYAGGELHPISRKLLIRHLGTTYNTIWTVGCPHRCAFCSQVQLIALDRGHGEYRGPSPDYIITEIQEARKRHPLDYVIFYDSNFLGRDPETLALFARKFRRETGLKFILSGVNPASITEEKIRILLEGGLVRMKIGFESASDATLRRFNRPVSTEQLRNAASILGRFAEKMAAPAFEMIVDNPFETTEEIYRTLDFLDQTPPPFTINLFSLQFMPGTPLSREAVDYSLVEEQMEKEYMFSYRPTLLNSLISLYAVMKPPRMLSNLLRRLIVGREHLLSPALKSLLYKLMLVRRAFNQARFRDFSTFPAPVMLLHHRIRAISGRFRSGSP